MEIRAAQAGSHNCPRKQRRSPWKSDYPTKPRRAHLECPCTGSLQAVRLSLRRMRQRSKPPLFLPGRWDRQSWNTERWLHITRLPSRFGGAAQSWPHHALKIASPLQGRRACHRTHHSGTEARAPGRSARRDHEAMRSGAPVLEIRLAQTHRRALLRRVPPSYDRARPPLGQRSLRPLLDSLPCKSKLNRSGRRARSWVPLRKRHAKTAQAPRTYGRTGSTLPSHRPPIQSRQFGEAYTGLQVNPTTGACFVPSGPFCTKTDEHRAQYLPSFRARQRHAPEILNAAFICRYKEGRKKFFSEEKNQKTFASASRFYPAEPTPQLAKVFCFFSSEKKIFLRLRYGLRKR